MLIKNRTREQFKQQFFAFISNQKSGHLCSVCMEPLICKYVYIKGACVIFIEGHEIAGEVYALGDEDCPGKLFSIYLTLYTFK